MSAPIVVATPIAGALLYSFATLSLKRATAGGAGPWRVSFVANWVTALCFVPVFFLSPQPFAWEPFQHAVLNGLVFFVGQIFTFLALSRGDISVATQILGTKVIMVAALAVLMVHQTIPPTWWWAAFLTAAATALLGGGASRVLPGQVTFRRSLVYGFSAAISFSFTDILSQMWAMQWGFLRYAPVMFGTVAICSLGIIPMFGGRLTDLPAGTWRWLWLGSLLLALQAGIVAMAIITFGDATLINILYASRGIWTVLLVWLAGHWFGNEERSHGHGVMMRRLAGTVLLLIAIMLVLRK